MTVGDLMAECRNYFVDRTTPYIDGTFAITNGVITPNDGLTEGDYIAVTGSRLNDGVYKPEVAGGNFTLTDAENETFTGRVWILHPPRAFVNLVSEITTWQSRQPETNVVSESFGKYSRTLATDANGNVRGWASAFASRLQPYRRMFKAVNL